MSGWFSQAAGSHWAMVKWEMKMLDVHEDFFLFFVSTLEAICIFFFFFFWQNNTKTRWCGAKLMKDKCGFVVRLGIYSGTWYLLMFWPIWFLVCLMHVCRLLGGGVWICMLVGGVLVCTVYVVQVLGFVCGCWCLVQWWGYWFLWLFWLGLFACCHNDCDGEGKWCDVCWVGVHSRCSGAWGW